MNNSLFYFGIRGEREVAGVRSWAGGVPWERSHSASSGEKAFAFRRRWIWVSIRGCFVGSGLYDDFGGVMFPLMTFPYVCMESID